MNAFEIIHNQTFLQKLSINSLNEKHINDDNIFEIRSNNNEKDLLFYANGNNNFIHSTAPMLAESLYIGDISNNTDSSSIANNTFIKDGVINAGEINTVSNANLGGNLVVDGNLIVKGTTTTIQSTKLLLK